jgi:hypothetical protein
MIVAPVNARTRALEGADGSTANPSTTALSTPIGTPISRNLPPRRENSELRNIP